MLWSVRVGQTIWVVLKAMDGEKIKSVEIDDGRRHSFTRITHIGGRVCGDDSKKRCGDNDDDDDNDNSVVILKKIIK